LARRGLAGGRQGGKREENFGYEAQGRGLPY
jgi:hypothetical protein